MRKTDESIAAIERLKILNEQLGSTILWPRHRWLSRVFSIHANRLNSLPNNFTLFNDFTRAQYQMYKATCKLLDDFNYVNQSYDDLNLHLFKAQILEHQNKIYKQLSLFRKINYFLRFFLKTNNLGLLIREKWVQYSAKKRTKHLKANHLVLYNYYTEVTIKIRQSITRFRKKEIPYETSKAEINQLIKNAKRFYRDYINKSGSESAINFSLKDCEYYVREWSPQWERTCEHYKNQLGGDASKEINSMLQRLNQWEMELQRPDSSALASSLNDFQALHIGRTNNLWKKRGELEEKRLLGYKFIGLRNDWRKKDWMHVKKFLADWDAQWNQSFTTLQNSLDRYWINVNNHCREIFSPSLALEEKSNKSNSIDSFKKLIPNFDNQRTLSEQWLEDKNRLSERNFLINLSIQLNSKDVNLCQNKLRKALRLKYHPDHHQDVNQEATIIYNEIEDVCQKSAQVLNLLLADDKTEVMENTSLLQQFKKKFDEDFSQMDTKKNTIDEKIEKLKDTLEKQQSAIDSLQEEFREFRRRFLNENSYQNNFFHSSIDNDSRSQFAKKDGNGSSIEKNSQEMDSIHASQYEDGAKQFKYK